MVSEEVDDGLEEETKVRKKEKEKKKDKPKEKQETGWEYSQMIGIR